MELEVFLVSIIYWVSILGIGLFLHRRLSTLGQKISTLEQGGKTDED